VGVFIFIGMVNIFVSIVLLGGAVSLLFFSKTKKKDCGCGSCSCQPKL